MKRHPALVPLSHDHHAELVQARRLRLASGSDVHEARLEASVQYVAAFADTARHLQLEEEHLFPAFAACGGDSLLLDEVLEEHQELRSLAATLAGQTAAGHASSETMAQLADVLEAHVRREERVLFPLIERTLGDEELRALDLSSSSITAAVDQGGEAPCLADLVCPECGAVEPEHRAECSHASSSRD